VNNVRESLAVSEEALISQGAKKSVMVVETPTGEGDQKVWAVSSKPVTIGTRMAGYAEVTLGLKSGDQVIVDGVVKAKPGEKVRIVGEKSIADTVRTAIDHAVPGKQDELTPADNPTPQAN
jgi:hypothetical protein